MAGIYIPKDKLVALIIMYKQTGSRTVYNEIGKIFYLMIINILRRPCFISYSKDRKDEIISNSCFKCIKKLDAYDPTYIAEPFSYFTRTIYREIFQCLNSNKKRDSIIKPISYVENLENKAFRKSVLFDGNKFDDELSEKPNLFNNSDKVLLKKKKLVKNTFYF